MLKKRWIEKWADLPVKKSPRGIPLEPVRILHGQGEKDPFLSSLNIDFFPPLTIISLYKKLEDSEVEDLADQVKSFMGEGPLLVQDRSARPFCLRLKRGEIPRELVLEEGGLKFLLHPERGQNPGFFTDMRAGRRKIAALLEGDFSGLENPVLNLFSYTCVLSLISLRAGASKVVNIDMNRKSLEIGKQNHEINQSSIPGGYRGKSLFLPHDIFKSFGRLGKEGPYRLIIADPPPSQKGSFDLKKDYPRLLRRLPNMLLPRGKILFSLNHPGWNWEDFETMLREFLPPQKMLERIPPPEDFQPLIDGEGLKLILYHS